VILINILLYPHLYCTLMWIIIISIMLDLLPFILTVGSLLLEKNTK